MGRKRLFLAGRRAVLITALSTSFVLVSASAAMGAHTCTSGISPKGPGSASALKVACVLDHVATASSNIKSIAIHDALDAYWHRGAARSVATAVSSGFNTLTGGLVAEDVGRPISGPGIAGGAFIVTVAGANGTMSKPATATSPAATAKLIEHTTARVIQDAIVATAGPKHLKSATAKFVAGDVNKSVSGAAFSAGAKITAVGVDGASTYATVSPAPTAASAADTVTVGGTEYSGANPTYTGTYHRQLVKTTGATCAGSTLTKAGTSPNFVAEDKNLKVTFLNAAGAAIAGTWKISSRTNPAAVLSAGCPGAALWNFVVIGEAGANAPKNNDPVMSLGVTMNLNPALNATSDDCGKNTYDGFTLTAGWRNPGSFAVGALAVAPNGAIAQLAFITSVVSFGGYIVQVATDAQQLGPHFDFVFPSLPTSISVCPLTAPTTTNKVTIAFGFAGGAPTPAAGALPTGTGNPNSPAIRALGPQTGSFIQKVTLTSAGAVGPPVVPPIVTQLSGTACVIAAATVAPNFACGDG